MAKSKKQKRQKYIRKILSDGKVSKKEVKKAAKKGIRLSRITSAAKKAAQPGNPFSGAASSPVRFAGANKTKTTPAPAITIAAGAQKLVDRDTARREAAKVAGISNTTPAPAPPPAPPAPPNPPPVDPAIQALMDRNDLLQQQLDNLPDFESIFAQQAEQAAQQRADDLAQMQQQQALAMEEMAARQAEQERQRLLTAQTQQANMARAGLTPDFSIGGRARTDVYGTGGFKRRRRIQPATIAQGISAPAATGNLLNV